MLDGISPAIKLRTTDIAIKISAASFGSVELIVLMPVALTMIFVMNIFKNELMPTPMSPDSKPIIKVSDIKTL